MQVGRQPRRAVAAERVVVVVVVAHAGAQEARQPLARRPPRRPAADPRPPARAPARRATGSRPLREAGRQRRQRARRAAARRGAAPRRQVRWKGEKTVYGLPCWVRSRSRSSTAFRPGCAYERRRRASAARRAGRAGAANGPDVGAEVQLVAPDLARQRRQLALGRTVADHEPPPRAPARRPGRAGTRAGTACAARSAWRPRSSRSSRQKTGTTRSWRSSAPRSAGWSCTRRSRRYRERCHLSRLRHRR